MAKPIIVNASEHSRWQLEARGPVLQRVLVALHPLTAKTLVEAGKSVPEPLQLEGLIDTGSDACVIRRELALALGLQQVDSEMLAAVHGATQTVPVYYARIILPNGQEHKARIIGADLTGAYRLLIGRDLLRRCKFTYDGPKGSFRLDFPDQR